MLDLTEVQRVIIDALIDGPIAWQSPEQLATASHFPLELVEDTLCNLDQEGWLTVWDREEGITVTLTVLAANRLGTRLVEYGRSQTLRWARQDDPDPAPTPATHVCHEARDAGLDSVVDPGFGPEFLVDEEDEHSRQKGARKSRNGREDEWFPRPIVLVGIGLTPWPGPGQGAFHRCPACRSNPLAPRMYCIYCDRWGLDHLLRNVPVRRQDPPQEMDWRRKTQKSRREKRRARFQSEFKRQLKGRKASG